MKVYLQKLSAFDTRVERHRILKASMYAIIEKSIPLVIWQIISATENFKANIILKQDARRLWRLLKERFGTTNADVLTVTEDGLEGDFYALTQERNEDLSEYHKRFLDQVQNSTRLKLQLPLNPSKL